MRTPYLGAEGGSLERQLAGRKKRNKKKVRKRKQNVLERAVPVNAIS
jgi:hypothetical protein